MSEFQIDIDNTSLEKAVQSLRNISGGAQLAITKALDATGHGIRKDGSKAASDIFFVEKESVNSRMRVSSGQTPQGYSVTVSRKGPRFYARSFPHDRNTTPGVRGGNAVYLRTRRDGSGSFLNAEDGLSKAFVATLPGRGRGVYRRIGQYRDRLTHARGLSVPDMLGDPEVRRIVEDGASERFNKELDRQVQQLLDKEGQA